MPEAEVAYERGRKATRRVCRLTLMPFLQSKSRMMSQSKVVRHLPEPAAMRRNRVCLTLVGLAVACGSLLTSLPYEARPAKSATSFPRSGAFRYPLRERQDAMAAVPPVILWAWERPEDLRFLDPSRVGVAFLARTIFIAPPPGRPEEIAPRVFVRPRLQPLRLAPGTALIAVVRIETPPAFVLTADVHPGKESARNDPPEVAQGVASSIAELEGVPGVRAIQVDFDAAQSQRAFYADLLRHLRTKLPEGFPVSITALASWCLGDAWIDGLPVEEAVPMLFRMGADTATVARELHAGRDFRLPLCRDSLGLSTDESFSRNLIRKAAADTLWRERRVYLFHPRAWTREALESTIKELQP